MKVKAVTLGHQNERKGNSGRWILDMCLRELLLEVSLWDVGAFRNCENIEIRECGNTPTNENC